MNLKEPINARAFIEEINRHFEDRYKAAKDTAEGAKKEILMAVDMLKSLPEASSELFEKALGFWVRDFSATSSYQIETNEVSVKFGGYDRGHSIDMRGDIGHRFTTDKKQLVPGDYRAVLIILPAPK